MIRLRNISILLLLMLLGLPTVSKAKDAFYIQPFNIVPGDTKTISLNLDNENVYRGFQTDIVLPEGLSIVKNANNSLAISLTNRASAFALTSNEVGDRALRLLGYSAQYETISGDNGALVDIQVKASSDFKGGYVQLKNTIFSNKNNQDVSMDDSQVLVQTKEQNFISIAGGELTAGKGKAFALELTNESSLTACQFDVVVPSGLSLDLAKCSVTGRCSSSHQLTSKNLGNGRYRFVCMSMDNTTFVGHSGTILNLWLNAESSARDHKKVKIENVVFSDAKAQTYRLEPISFDVNVSFVVATSIRLSESSLSLQVDDSKTLTATVLPENCTDKSVVWESSNEQVATVDANGNIVAKAEGQCVINAYSADRSVKAECAVTVTKIPLTVRVEDASRKYGDENPQFKISYEGFRDGDTETRLTTSAVAQTDANLKSAVGDYEITLSGAESNKYSFSYVVGKLSVTKAPLVISAGNYTKKQGDAMPEFKASYSGFKNGENEAVLTKQPQFSTDATTSSAPADYVVNVSGAEADNYEITYQSGTLTITEISAPIVSIVNNELQISTELDNAVIYYTLDGTEPDENSKVYSEPVSLYASCVIKAVAVVGGVKSKVTETEYHNAQYPDIVKVGDLITANIINNGEENLLMAFKVTSVFPFEVTMIHRSNYQEGWNNEQITGDIEVPSSVTANGISYSVKRIGDSALAYTSKAASLKLNEGLEYIDDSAFKCFGQLKMKELVVPNSVKVVGGAFVKECNSLNTIVLGTGVEGLQRNAFWGIGALKEIYSLNSIPPVCDVPDQTFVDIPDDVALYVPIGSKEAYETAPGWDHFAGHIVEIDPTAIKPIVISVKDDASWYNLQGVKFSEKPTIPGIYIYWGKKIVIK